MRNYERGIGPNEFYEFSEAIDSSNIYSLSNVPDLDRIKDLKKVEALNNRSELDSSKDFDYYDAKSYIGNLSKDYDVIVLNESHHYPYHRKFAESLLDTLWDNGYRNLFVETLSNFGKADKKLPQVDCLEWETGFYSREPTFANFLRKALSKGFKLYPYEAKHSVKDREYCQAKNIYQNLKSLKGKSFIYCGYDHVLKGEVSGWGKAMFGHLSEMSNKRMLSVSQTFYNDVKLDVEYQSAVIEDKEGVRYPKDEKVDVIIVHKLDKRSTKRFEWKKTKDNDWKKVDFIPRDIVFPILVSVFIQTPEKIEPIPYDIVEVSDLGDDEWIIVPKTNYFIVLSNREKRIVFRPNQLEQSSTDK